MRYAFEIEKESIGSIPSSHIPTRYRSRFFVRMCMKPSSKNNHFSGYHFIHSATYQNYAGSHQKLGTFLKIKLFKNFNYSCLPKIPPSTALICSESLLILRKSFPLHVYSILHVHSYWYFTFKLKPSIK